MTNYLTIGQVAQIKGINVKSLRYYDKLGILKPAYTDKNTGYRYYTPQQLLYIDMIRLLIELDIPLKNWWSYFNADYEFDLDRLLSDGRRIAEHKIDTICLLLQKIDMAMTGIDATEQCTPPDEGIFYKRYIPERHYLCQSISFEHSVDQFQAVMHELFQLGESYHITTNFPAGLLCDVKDGTEHFSIFVKIYEPAPFSPHYRCIPSGYYRCHTTTPMDIYHLAERYPEEYSACGSLTIIEEDLIGKNIHVETPLVELQFPVSGP